MLHFKVADYGPAVGVSRPTATRRLANVPHIGKVNQRFALVDALPDLRSPEAAVRLLAVSHSDGSFYVGGDDVLPQARRVESWLQSDPAMAARLHNVRVTFFNALAGMKSATLFRDSERLRLLLPLSDNILPFILTGDKRGLPFFGSFSRAFALVHQAGPYEDEIVAPEGLQEVMRGAA